MTSLKTLHVYVISATEKHHGIACLHCGKQINRKQDIIESPNTNGFYFHSKCYRNMATKLGTPVLDVQSDSSWN